MASRRLISISRSWEQWYPIFVRSRRDIERLNRLFEKGWFLDQIGLEEMPFLAFNAPLPDPDAPEGPEEVAEGSPEDNVLMLVLARGTVKGRQRAMIVEPDEHGYRDLG